MLDHQIIKSKIVDTFQEAEDLIQILSTDFDVSFYNQNISDIKTRYELSLKDMSPLYQIEEFKNLQIKLNKLIDTLTIILEQFSRLNKLWSEIDNEFEMKWKSNLIWTTMEQNKHYAKSLLQSGFIDIFEDNIELIKTNYENLKEYRQNENDKYSNSLKSVLVIIESNQDLLVNALSEDQLSSFNEYNDTITSNLDNINDPQYAQRGNIKMITEKIKRLIVEAKKNNYKRTLIQNLRIFLGAELIERKNLDFSDETIQKHITENTISQFYSQQLSTISTLNRYN